MKIILVLICICKCDLIEAFLNQTIQTNATSNNNLKELCNNDENSTFLKNLFHNETQKCYPEMARGPCGKLMAFYRESEDSDYGVCDCITYDDCIIGRPIMYWEPTKRCYFAYDQGPCEDCEWIVFNENWQPECQDNPCPPSAPTNDVEDEVYSNPRPETIFYFVKNGSCYRTNTSAHCKENERAFFRGTENLPSCLTREPYCRESIALSSKRPCPPGTRRDDKSDDCLKIVSISP